MNIREGSSLLKFSDGDTFSASELTCATLCAAISFVFYLFSILFLFSDSDWHGDRMAPCTISIMINGLKELYKRYQYMIDRKLTQYVTLYVTHNKPSIVQWDPKVSVLLWLERRRPAQSERHTKSSNTSVVLQGEFFQVVDYRNANTSSDSKTKIC